MTNREIIDEQRSELLKAGILQSVGKVKLKLADGSIVEVDEPEEIHTYAAWKSMGYLVRHGEKSNIKFPIWKYTSKTTKDDDGEETTNSRMFMKVAAFFTPRQVEKVVMQ